MSNERLDSAESIFQIAADLPSHAREAFLAERCGDDATLRAMIDRLLRHHDGGMPDFLDPPATQSPSPAREPARYPLQIGSYEVLGIIGEGGMATVYEARQSNPRRVVALKVIKGSRGDPELVRRFRFETRILGQFTHPGVARVYEAGETPDGVPFFAMEFVSGLPLTEFAQHHRLATAARLDLMAKVCDAVHHAHEAGILHRDLKPANILVSDGEGGQPQPKILDFGIARALRADLQTMSRHTVTGQMVGTLAYMSPEQIVGNPEDLDPRSDVYQLGVILYELLAGKRPFAVTGLSVPMAGRVILEQEPPPLKTIDPDLRGDVESMVGKAMAKEKERRYPSAAALGDDIHRHLSHQPIAARPSSGFYRFRKFARRRREAITGLAAGLLVAIVATIAFLVQIQDEPAGPDTTTTRQLTFGGDILVGDLDPAGQMVAYISESGNLTYLDLDSGQEDAAPVSTASPGDTLSIANLRQCNLRWSPSGQELATICLPRPGANFPLTIIFPRRGHAAQEVVRGFSGYVWSPDGRRLAGIRRDGWRNQLCVLDRATGGLVDVPVTGDVEPSQVTAWTDSDLLYFSNAREDSVYVVPVAGGAPVGVSAAASVLCLPGKAGIFYYQYTGQSVFYRTVDDEGVPVGPAHVVQNRVPASSRLLSVAGDGRRTLVGRAGTPEIWLGERRPSAGAEPSFLWTQVVRSSRSTTVPRFSPDGTRIAMVMTPLGEAVSSVVVQSLIDGSRTVVTRARNIYGVDWSPDGSELVLSADYKMTRLDSRDGGRVREIPGPRAPRQVRWLPDGRIIYDEKGLVAHRQYCLLDPTTGSTSPWPPNADRGTLFQFAPSPDGRTLAVAGNRHEGADVKVWLMDLDGPGERLLYDGWAAPFHWSADGRWVYLITERLPSPPEGARSRVIRVATDGAAVEDVADLPAPVPTWANISMSRDERRIACAQRRTGVDLWLLDGQPAGN